MSAAGDGCQYRVRFLISFRPHGQKSASRAAAAINTGRCRQAFKKSIFDKQNYRQMKTTKLTSVLLFLMVTTVVFGQIQEPYFKKLTTQENLKLTSDKQSKLNKLKAEKYHKELNFVKIGDLKKSLRNETLIIDVPGTQGSRIEAKTKYFDLKSNSEFLWSGEFKNGDVLLISKEGRTFGQIRIKNRVYKIEYMENDIAAVVEYDMDLLNQMKCGTKDEITKNPNSNSRTINQGNISYSTQSLSQPVVRVLVLFTPAAQNTGQNINDLVSTALGQFLSAEVNSWVSVQLQLAGIQAFNFTETGVINNDIQSLRNSIAAQQLRNNFEADIVILLTNGNYPNIGGIVAQIGPDDDDAYGIVQVANATSTITFSHETAHLFGCRHQIAADPTAGDAHGHEWNTGFWPFRSKYGSIMRTLDQGRTRVLHFSNPSVNHEGRATGVTGEAFNAKTLNFNGWVLQDFRFSTPAMVVNIQGPGSANNGDPLFFTSSVYNAQNPVSLTWQANIGGGYFNAGSSSTLSMTMPTDNDLELILTAVDGNSQQASDYAFVRNNFLGGGCTICPDSTLNDAISSKNTINDINVFNGINVYPNPASDRLTIQLSDGIYKEERFQIIDSNGLTISENIFIAKGEKQNSTTLDISELKKGLYFLKYSSGNSNKTIRFIKK